MDKQQMFKRMEQLYKQAENWPRWKKEFFNNYIAVSVHARKVKV